LMCLFINPGILNHNFLWHESVLLFLGQKGWLL
jgi:hypothetical protein